MKLVQFPKQLGFTVLAAVILLAPSANAGALKPSWILKQKCATVGSTVVYLDGKRAKISLLDTGVTIFIDTDADLVSIANNRTKKIFQRRLTGWQPSLTNRMMFAFGQDLNGRVWKKKGLCKICLYEASEWESISPTTHSHDKLILSSAIESSPVVTKLIHEIYAGTAVTETIPKPGLLLQLSYYDREQRIQAACMITKAITKGLIEKATFVLPTYARVAKEEQALMQVGLEDLF